MRVRCPYKAGFCEGVFKHLDVSCIQVMEWTQTILQAGEAFTGGPAADLRASLQKSCGRFFPAHHSANISLAVSLLEAEPWTPLPVPYEL